MEGSHLAIMGEVKGGEWGGDDVDRDEMMGKRGEGRDEVL